MTPDELNAIRERADKATPGPWEAKYGDVFSTVDRAGVAYDIEGQGACTDEDAEFLAAARQDIPALLAYVDELERERARSVVRYADLTSGVKRVRALHTDAEVAALPPGTILRDARGRAWYRGEGSWVGSGEGPAYAPEVGWGLGALPFPALILWHGERGTA